LAIGGLKAMKRSNGLAMCDAASTVGIGARPARETWPLLHTSPRQHRISPRGVEIGLDLDRHGRAHRRPGELVLARPLHPHGTPPAAPRQAAPRRRPTSSAPLWP
jgi:hypothetical protein